MAATLTTDLQTVARLRAAGWKAGRILSAIGHPGYGQAFASQAIAQMEAYGLTAHEAIYGGMEASLKMAQARGLV